MVTATSSTGNATTDKINNSRNSLANNEQTFLKLLTTQLKNQDPLSPTDTTQMTSQITQMTMAASTSNRGAGNKQAASASGASTASHCGKRRRNTAAHRRRRRKSVSPCMGKYPFQ